MADLRDLVADDENVASVDHAGLVHGQYRGVAEDNGAACREGRGRCI
jgi:hypothetical protein